MYCKIPPVCGLPTNYLLENNGRKFVINEIYSACFHFGTKNAKPIATQNFLYLPIKSLYLIIAHSVR
jgi:hypothetical protein